MATMIFVGMDSVGMAPAQTPDYSAGVKKIFQLGLTDARQAKYVTVQSTYGRWEGGGLMERGAKMTGNAWLLEAKTNGHAVVLVNQVTVTELIPTKVAEQRMKARMEALAARIKPGQVPDEADLEEVGADSDALDAMEELSRVQTGDWKEADLNADIRGLLEYLNKAGGERDYELKRNAAGLFLFAAHVHNRGQTAEANQIISLLFQKAGDSRKVISTAMSQIADAEYSKVYAEFEKSGDWARYLAGMEGLLGQFAAAWHVAPVVERVAGMVRKQVEQKSAPALTGAGLTEEDTRLATLLGQSNTVLSLHHPVFGGVSWLASDPAMAGARPQKKKTPGPLDLIQQRGSKAIPFLAVLLKDEWLVRIKGGLSERYYSSGLDEEALSSDEVEDRLEYFSRPRSRGEIARRILEPLVLARDEASREENKPTLDELARKSRAWYDQHKTENRSELLRQLLAEGRQEPLYLLMDSKEPADRAAVESYLLATNKLAENMSSVTRYAQQQGGAVKPFVQKYLAELRKLPSLVPKRETAYSDAKYLKQREEQARAALKVLEDLVSDKTAEQMLQELTGSDKKWKPQEMYTAGRALSAKLAQEDPDKALTLLLQACLKAKDDALAEYLVQSASMLRWAQSRTLRTAGTPPPKPREFKIETHAALWKQVMAQERRPSQQRGYSEGDALSFQAQVASAIEGFYSPPQALRGENGLATARIVGAKVYEITVQRGLARLAGKSEAELPGYPDKSKVSKERLAQIGQLLRESTSDQQHEVVGRLTLDEVVAVPDLVSADSKLNEKLVPGSHLIRNVRMTPTNEALARVCLPLTGKALDRKALEALITECKKLAAQGSNLVVSVERRLPLAGLTAQVRANSDQNGRGVALSGNRRAGNQAILTATLRSEGPGGVHGYIHWPITLAAAPKPAAQSTEPGKPADDDVLPANSPGMGEYLQRQEEEFWKSLEKLFEPGRDACQPYVCTLSVQQPNAAEDE